MDEIIFGMKRGHLASARFGHRLLAPFGLTPARFDMLYALQNVGLYQTQLAQMLGVARSTVSRMLAALEKLGWVCRFRLRNMRIVSLTRAGAALLARAIKRVCGRRRPFRMVMQSIRDGSKVPDFVRHDAVVGTLHRLRRTFGDRATLHYWRLVDL